jgi:hypothetical protein
MPTTTGERGQATVELVAVLPLLAVLGFGVCVPLGLALRSLWKLPGIALAVGIATLVIALGLMSAISPRALAIGFPTLRASSRASSSCRASSASAIHSSTRARSPGATARQDGNAAFARATASSAAAASASGSSASTSSVAGSTTVTTSSVLVAISPPVERLTAVLYQRGARSVKEGNLL